MAFQAAPNVAHITVEGRQDRQLTIYDLDWEISGGGITPTNLATLVNAVASWATTALAPQVSQDWTFERVRGRDLTTVNGAVFESGTATVGGVDDESAPNNVAMCLSKRTGFSGRSFRGRVYVCGIPNDNITLNTIDTAYIDNLLLVFNQLVGAGSFTAGWELCVLSRQTGGVLRPTGVPSPVVQFTSVTPFVKSMRSREVGHGA